MIGKEKLSDIQADLAEEFAKQGIDPHGWFATRIENLQKKKQRDERQIEALEILRNAIASAGE